jgi:hypothetical protein
MFLYRAFYRQSKSNQQVHKIIGKYKIYIFNPYICFGKQIVIFRWYISEIYKCYLHPNV